MYIVYMISGALYLIVKIVFFSAGYLHPGAIAHGAIPAFLITGAGFLAKRDRDTGKNASLWHTAMVALPVLSLLITPVFMYWKQGTAWLDNGRLPVLVIYECLAIIQILIAFAIRRHK